MNLLTVTQLVSSSAGTELRKAGSTAHTLGPGPLSLNLQKRPECQVWACSLLHQVDPSWRRLGLSPRPHPASPLFCLQHLSLGCGAPALNHQLVFARSCLRWVELLAASPGIPREAPALVPRGLGPAHLGWSGVGLYRPRQSCSCLFSSWFPCEPLTPASVQLGRAGRIQSTGGRGPLFSHHQDPGWRMHPGHLPPLTTRDVSLCQVCRKTGHIWTQVTLPDGYWLPGYWLPTAGSRLSRYLELMSEREKVFGGACSRDRA